MRGQRNTTTNPFLLSTYPPDIFLPKKSSGLKCLNVGVFNVLRFEAFDMHNQPYTIIIGALALLECACAYRFYIFENSNMNALYNAMQYNATQTQKSVCPSFQKSKRREWTPLFIRDFLSQKLRISYHKCCSTTPLISSPHSRHNLSPNIKIVTRIKKAPLYPLKVHPFWL